MNVAKVFGASLLRARKRLGISQEVGAIRASLHRTEIGPLERGERVARIDTAIKPAGGVGVPLCELLDGIKWKPGTMQGQMATPDPQPLAEPLLDASEAAQLLRVPRSTLYELVRSRGLPHVRVGRALRFTRVDLSQWVLANTFRPRLEAKGDSGGGS